MKKYLIKNLINNDNSSVASWIFKGKKIEITNKGRILALEKQDGNILIIHIDKAYDEDSAFIYSPSGKIIKKIINFEKKSGCICYDDVYYVDKELTLIAGSRAKRIACVIDEKGNYIRSYETR
ncbi:hypothetical protein MNBD_GAMMA11-172 [hydrothermal vent metagenome]|uniref:Uncharacterized protein n=1 Tax=hydrothermal vent metagenome TaxID=652676 RepID=A0A3B0XKI0_9ZZZZ